MKAHKGIIRGVRHDIPYKDRAGYPRNKGFIIYGRFVNHPTLDRSPGGHTSLVTKVTPTDDPDVFEVETLNSRYTWEKPHMEDL